MKRILFIDDHQDILEANRSYFAEHNFNVCACNNGTEAVLLLQRQAFDCIVLDVAMPGLDGYEVCTAIRRQYDTPVIFLSCLDQPDDKVHGLMLGGDVYMTKPYDLRELYAQVLACLRRGEKSAVISAGDFMLDWERRIVRLHDHCAVLSKKEIALLSLLIKHQGQTLRKERLWAEIWQGEDPDENRLQGLIRNLRNKVEFASEHMGKIASVYGTGYRLDIPKKMDTGGAV